LRFAALSVRQAFRAKPASATARRRRFAAHAEAFSGRRTAVSAKNLNNGRSGDRRRAQEQMRSPDRPFDGLAVIVMRSAGPKRSLVGGRLAGAL